MKRWIAPAGAVLALVIAASGDAGAGDRKWRDEDAPQSGCAGFINKDGRKDHDCGFGSEDPKASPGVTAGDIARQLRANGYQEIYDIDREGDRFEATALDPDGDPVIVYFDAENGKFIRQRHY